MIYDVCGREVRVWSLEGGKLEEAGLTHEESCVFYSDFNLSPVT